MRRVCVIGAGSSGIVAAKTFHERGIPFDCFEKGSNVGGLWRYENDSGASVAYRSLHINTSRAKMQFADFPMPRDYPDFPHHSQIARYFDAYVDHFGFRDRITFRTMVQRVEPLADGTFRVETTDATGHSESRTYTDVVVANGHHWHPRVPTFPGTFAGTTLHAGRYRTPESFAGQRVLVLGAGNSGCDIACEVSRVADRTVLAMRHGVHLIPKYLFGRPLDKLVPPWMWRHLPLRAQQLIFGTALRLARGKLKRFHLPEPRHRILEEHPTISSDLLNLIGHGRVTVKPNIQEFTGAADGREVLFTDGTREPVDAIVYATGYDIRVPFLAPEVFDARDNEVRLYKLVVHPEHRGLYFIGLVQPWGAIMPLAEEQSKWVADLVEGKCALPTRDEMLTGIGRDRGAMRRRYTASSRHTIQVDFYPYLDELRKERRRGARETVRAA
ncbi:NAD(P)-binding domain-containing protein [Gemmata sp. JC673]|uniref:Flavin-containing monooxygenase 5 n=1 Tax=Gemmata algarum TaxID=2975278 RepID=A0ABU5EWS9_9BACT|nr:NAD(P)-binding domain-containing protein [Gemmata algarum]MDY3559747.1 NAD(P)-binding domain-containing protein [Gemmata algarum]